MSDELSIAEVNILEYARQWARCMLFRSYIDDAGNMCLTCGDDHEMHAEAFMMKLQYEAKLMMMEKATERAEGTNGKWMP